MGNQVMHNEAVFYLSNCEGWTALKYSSQESFTGLTTSDFAHLWVSLINKRESPISSCTLSTNIDDCCWECTTCALTFQSLIQSSEKRWESQRWEMLYAKFLEMVMVFVKNKILVIQKKERSGWTTWTFKRNEKKTIIFLKEQIKQN